MKKDYYSMVEGCLVFAILKHESLNTEVGADFSREDLQEVLAWHQNRMRQRKHRRKNNGKPKRNRHQH